MLQTETNQLFKLLIGLDTIRRFEPNYLKAVDLNRIGPKSYETITSEMDKKMLPVKLTKTDRLSKGSSQMEQEVYYGSRQGNFHTISGGVVSGWPRIIRRSASFMSSPIKLIIGVLNKSARGCIKVAAKG